MSRNYEYCQFCFQKGSFAEPGLTLQGMLDKSADFMTARPGFTEEKAREMSNSVIPKLKRRRKDWQN